MVTRVRLYKFYLAVQVKDAKLKNRERKGNYGRVFRFDVVVNNYALLLLLIRPMLIIRPPEISYNMQ